MREMKDSGVEWIGKIPSTWDLIKGKNVYNIDTGKLDVNAYDENGIYPFFTCSKESRQINKYAFDCEALLVAGNGIVGYTQYYKGKFNAYQRTYILSEFNNVFPGFLKHYVSNNLMTEVSPKSNGSVIEFIKLGDLKDFPICIPSIDEQHRIADYLDEKCSKIDAIIERQQAVIEKLKAYKQAVITEAVTKGLNSNVELKDSCVDWIGKFPSHWNISRVANLYTERTEPGNDELPVLMVSINTGVSDGEVSDEERLRMVNRSEDKSKYKRVYPDDLVYNMMRAWQGAFGAVRVDGLVSPAYVVAKPKRELDSRYIEALFRTESAKAEMGRYSYGIADFRLRLYWQYFKNIRLCLPPIEEQREIADWIDKKSKAIDEIISGREIIIEKLQQYKKSLIYEVVTGKKEV